MKRGWCELPLGEAPLQIIDGDRGKAYPKHGDFSDDGYCLFLSAANVTNFGFDFSECQFISEQKDEELRKGRLTRNDVVLTTRGTLGNAAYYGDSVPYDHVRINSGMVVIRTDATKLLPEFLYGFLRSPSFQKQVEQLRSGVAQPQLPIRDITKIKLPYPPKPRQERIVSVLSAYDDLLENNRRRMALLEEAARLLYREWFVRLRFPGHEHTRIIDGVPEGWERSRICDFGDVITGKTPSTREGDNYGGDIPFIKTPDMHDNVFVTETETHLTEKGANTQPRKFIPPHAILASCIGTIGVVSMTSERSQFNQQINALVPFDDSYRYYCFFAFKDLKPRMDAIGGGATMGNVNKTKFEALEVLKPAMPLLRDFHEFSLPLFQQVHVLSIQNEKLRAARDLLLPRLMSGEIAV